jgi:hypothetical protein
MLFDVTEHGMRQKYDHEWGIDRNLEESVMAYFKIQCWHSPGNNE